MQMASMLRLMPPPTSSTPVARRFLILNHPQRLDRIVPSIACPTRSTWRRCLAWRLPIVCASNLCGLFPFLGHNNPQNWFSSLASPLSQSYRPSSQTSSQFQLACIEVHRAYQTVPSRSFFLVARIPPPGSFNTIRRQLNHLASAQAQLRHSAPIRISFQPRSAWLLL
jgi:hypothetical protein